MKTPEFALSKPATTPVGGRAELYHNQQVNAPQQQQQVDNTRRWKYCKLYYLGWEACAVSNHEQPTSNRQSTTLCRAGAACLCIFEYLIFYPKKNIFAGVQGRMQQVVAVLGSSQRAAEGIESVDDSCQLQPRRWPHANDEDCKYSSQETYPYTAFSRVFSPG